jgi:hypothetical protein
MKKIFNLVFPLTVALAASLDCASANAAQTNAIGAPDKHTPVELRRPRRLPHSGAR